MHTASTGRQSDNEAGADQAAIDVAAVLGADAAAMCFDDLLGDGEAEPGMGPEFLAGRTLAVEALEDRFELALGDARPGILDGDHHRIAATLGGDVDGGAGQ